VLAEPLIKAGRAFVQPGKEATMTLYPLAGTSVDELCELARAAVAEVAPEFGVAPNVHGVEVRPLGVDKGSGARRLAELLDLPLAAMAGVGDSDPDLSFLKLTPDPIGFSAAPANATFAVRQAVDYVAEAPFGVGLLEIVSLIEQRNRQQTLTDR
jgi:hydroxymethylpyrimidine pyrophosphatase-like HAD family hydrolase